MMSLLLAALLSCQDPVDASLKLLSDKDPAVRDAATADLMKTPLDKLALVEKRLKDPDADIAARVRRVMTYVLKYNVPLHKARFELRPLATLEVMREWVKGGADPKAPPKGYEAVRYADKAAKTAGYEQEWVLVGPTCCTSEDIVEARAEPDIQRGGRGQWLVTIQITPNGGEEFDRVAAELYERTPKGALAMLLDERIISAPIIMSPRFGGRAVIQGDYREKEAGELAVLLKEDRKTSFIRLEKDKGAAAPEKLLDAVKGIKGLDKVSLKKDSAEMEITGPATTAEFDVILLWQTLRDHGYRLVPKK